MRHWRDTSPGIPSGAGPGCRRDVFENPDTKPHFDTNHHLTIVWDPSTPEEAGEALVTTIRVTLPTEASLNDG
jgi:hypothetical protein